MIVPNAEPLAPEKVPELPPKDPAGPPNTEQPLPPPPPYTPRAGPSGSAHPPPPQRTPSTVLNPQNAQTVNHFEVFSKHNAITGTYLVDPLLPTPGFDSAKLRKRCRRNKRWGQGSLSEVHASFRTRHGAISLDLAAVAQDKPMHVAPGTRKVRTCITASSRHGRIKLNLFEIQPGRCIDLQAESRHGSIVIMVPPTFDGPLMFQTRYASSVTLLPAFSARSRTLRATDKETIVICSPSAASPSSPPAPTGEVYGEDRDRVLARTRHGRVVVGISGIDRMEDAPIGDGIFKKLGEFIELGGRAFGQYIEERARQLEKRLG
ncbi:hypothetical protein PYCCODRAFT_1433245 [Trametes coccinea BRFM310]|uniref:DUF7330 domain-containing protein n=1 Tax=Trametes coccinea (strain BRFM310) TaxID=1353009 RepID=A0A1Y2IUX9_TRAC3|nr:hypothetical protein PYCCODRAFT_1433245 [Trametes coccinea BRFM310]